MQLCLTFAQPFRLLERASNAKLDHKEGEAVNMLHGAAYTNLRFVVSWPSSPDVTWA